MASPFPRPFCGAHLYLWRNIPQVPELQKPRRLRQDEWDVIPPEWKHYRWDAMDVLFISPWIVTQSGEFALGNPYGSDGITNVVHRYKWVVANTREKNPKLKIFAVHWYDNDAHGMGLGALETLD